jgi:hypothetical protein
MGGLLQFDNSLLQKFVVPVGRQKGRLASQTTEQAIITK